HAAFVAAPLQQGLEIPGEEVALEDGHGVRDPAVSLRRVTPEVLVSVDASHAGQDTLSGCSGPSGWATCTDASPSASTSCGRAAMPAAIAWPWWAIWWPRDPT